MTLETKSIIKFNPILTNYITQTRPVHTINTLIELLQTLEGREKSQLPLREFQLD